MIYFCGDHHSSRPLISQNGSPVVFNKRRMLAADLVQDLAYAGQLAAWQIKVAETLHVVTGVQVLKGVLLSSRHMPQLERTVLARQQAAHRL
jgi:hypothetical protein